MSSGSELSEKETLRRELIDLVDGEGGARSSAAAKFEELEEERQRVIEEASKSRLSEVDLSVGRILQNELRNLANYGMDIAAGAFAAKYEEDQERFEADEAAKETAREEKVELERYRTERAENEKSIRSLTEQLQELRATPQVLGVANGDDAQRILLLESAVADLQGQLDRMPLPSGDPRYNRNVIRADAENSVIVWVTDSEGERREFRGDVRSSIRVAEDGCGFKVDEDGEFKDFFPASCNVSLAPSSSHAQIREAKWAEPKVVDVFKSLGALKVHLVVSNFWPVVNTSRRPVDANSQVDHTYGQKRDNRAWRLAYTGGNSDNVNKDKDGFRHPDGSYHEEPWLFDGVTTPYMPDCQTLFPFESVKRGEDMSLEVEFPFSGTAGFT